MTRYFVIAAVAVAWFAVYSIELMARTMHRSYAAFGSDLPSLTLLTFSALQSYVPWIVVGAGTLVVAILGLRGSAHLGRASAALALVTALGASLAVFSIALPQVRMCGGLGLPDWHVAQAPAPAAGSCGR